METFNGSVTLVGSGPLAQTIAYLLVQAQTPKFKMVCTDCSDNSDNRKYEPLLFSYNENLPKGENIESILKLLNKSVCDSIGRKVPAPDVDYSSSLEAALKNAHDTDIFIDATNSIESKKLVNEAAKEYGKPAVFCSASFSSGRCSAVFDSNWQKFDGKVQGPITSGVIGGHATNQAYFSSTGLQELVNEVVYTLPIDAEESEIRKRISDKHMTLVGVGTIGSIIGSVWASLGAKVTAIDRDIVELSNLTNQYVYYHSEDDPTLNLPKAKVFSRRLQSLLANTNETPDLVVPVQKEIKSEADIDAYSHDSTVICSAVDNGYAKKLVSDYALHKKKIASDVAADTEGILGHVIPYYPGKTICMHHSGIYNNSPDSITCPPGMMVAARILGALAVGESVACLFDEPLINGKILYNPYAPSPFIVEEKFIRCCNCVSNVVKDMNSLERRGFKVDRIGVVSPEYKEKRKQRA